MSLNNNYYSTQNQLLLNNLLLFYKKNNNNNLEKILPIISGETKLSLRIIDWFVTNYAKKEYIVYNIYEKMEDKTKETTNLNNNKEIKIIKRFKVYTDYKLKLKAYSKKRFDPFCRRERIKIPYNDSIIETTIGQLNFFKWCLENKILDYIEKYYITIENDMNNRNTTSKNKISVKKQDNKTRKIREELSISAVKSIKKEDIEIIVKFD